jgi:AcrR family transcriptional regulator
MSTGRRADAVRNRSLAVEAAKALLAEADVAITVEAIAKRAGLGAGTVVRAFGGKDALLDTAISELLAPVVRRARELLDALGPTEALPAFLAELITFQSAHHTIGDRVGELDLPATSALRAELMRVTQQMITGAQLAGGIRDDLDRAVLTVLIGETAFAIARAERGSGRLASAYLTVLMDGLRPGLRPGGATPVEGAAPPARHDSRSS